MKEVTLNEMLSAREKRVLLQQQVIQKYKCPIIYLTLNIPGPIKVFPGIPELFHLACRRMEHVLNARLVRITHQECVKENTGYEAIYSVDASPKFLKDILVPLEEEDDLGRLLDIDVLSKEGIKVSREDMGIPGRKCLLCHKPAQVCGRSRCHSVEELIAHINKVFAENHLVEGE